MPSHKDKPALQLVQQASPSDSRFDGGEEVPQAECARDWRERLEHRERRQGRPGLPPPDLPPFAA